MEMRLRIRAVSKRFGATVALDQVNLDVRGGEVHALIGENGAGKSTLMKILSGAHQPDSGSIELEGKPFAPENPHQGRRAGISMIYQELTLAPHLTVEENIMLGEEPGRLGWLNRREAAKRARAALAELHHDHIPLSEPVHALPVASRQIVEIARALVTRPRVVLMDEPTSSLTQEDAAQLFQAIQRLRASGTSIIYISHFLEECQQICKRYTVLRDGKSVASGAMEGADLREIVHQMVGRQVEEIYPRRNRQFGPVLLETRNLRGMSKPAGVSFQVHSGEIFGLAGLIGAGRTETARVCFGLDRLKSGTMTIAGSPRRRHAPSACLGLGMGMVSEDRKEEGLMLDRSIADNLTFTALEKVSRFGLIQRRLQHAASAHWINRLRVRARDGFQAVGELSGGNQQKVAIGRLLQHQARILLLDEPTRGIDVGSKAEIYRLLDELASQGRAILFISSYLPELIGVCDTIGVMCRGELAEIKPATEWTEHDIMLAAIGRKNPVIP